MSDNFSRPLPKHLLGHTSFPFRMTLTLPPFLRGICSAFILRWPSRTCYWPDSRRRSPSLPGRENLTNEQYTEMIRKIETAYHLHGA